MECQHRQNGKCSIAEKVLLEEGLKMEVKCEEDAYKTCSDCACPHTFNYVVASLVYIRLTNAKLLSNERRQQLVTIIQKGKNCILGGPGTELKKLLSYLHITSDENCGCALHAEQMNQWGSSECRNRIQEIVSWMKEECEKREWKWIWNESASRALILLACDLSDGVSWTSILLRLPSTLKQAYEKIAS